MEKNNIEEKPIVIQPEQLRTLIEWDAPARPFKARDREFFRTIASLLILIAVILFFAQQFMLILAIIATAFLAYVLNTVPPGDVHHKITTQGITTQNAPGLGLGVLASSTYSYEWKKLKSFFFSEKHGAKILNVDTVNKFPGRLMLLLGLQNQDEVKQIISKYLLYKEQAPISWLDKASSWLSQKIPLENELK